MTVSTSEVPVITTTKVITFVTNNSTMTVKQIAILQSSVQKSNSQFTKQIPNKYYNDFAGAKKIMLILSWKLMIGLVSSIST